jgi:hypothetical protein
MPKAPDCVEHDQPDELTAKVRREILREWTAHVEGMVRRTSDSDAACYIPAEEFRAGIESLFHESNAGNKGAVLQAIDMCFFCRRPVPAWVQSAFFNAYGDVTSGLFKSWDDVFGRPHKKGTQPAATRRRRRLATPIINLVRERQAAGEPISKDLFEAVGEEVQELISRGYLGEDNKKFSCKGTLVAEIYYEYKKAFDEAK